MQKKQTYLIILLAVLLYPTAYQFLHIFPHQHHAGHAECHECRLHENTERATIKEEQTAFVCHIYDFQYSVNEFIQLTALLPYRTEIIAKLSSECNSVYQKSSLRLSDSRAPPSSVI
jgi:hypothetical protein